MTARRLANILGKYVKFVIPSVGTPSRQLMKEILLEKYKL
jgi:hypothetical protein